MLGQSPLLTGFIIAAVLMVMSLWWFGVHRRHRIEREAGIVTLSTMKWRECLGLILQGLASEGFVEEPASRQAGEGGSEFLLRRNGQLWLLTYKHGTAYRLSEANVRDFANALQLQGAAHGMLVTLGQWETAARDAARRYGVDLLDGAAVWPKIRAHLPHGLMHKIHEHASAQTRRGLTISGVASVLIGLLVAASSQWLDAPSNASASSNAAPAANQTTGSPPVTPAIDAAVVQATEAAAAMQAIAALSDAERAERRVKAATGVAAIPQVRSAIWSTQSTLLISLSQSQGDEQTLISEACRILVQFEELRFSRLQLDPPPGSNLPTRWRQCQ